ncbi:MAG: glycosyltransferase [Erysipelotrichaceae bacterium]|nr:glycosyltransferase [Erysipelotrichaceae bacterium]
MKLLTITVPCYNSQDYMEKCVNSLLAGGERVEIIIIDDGSKDNTGAIADRLVAEHPNIVRVVHQENGGHGEGINQGLRHATGKYFKTVDSDDWVGDCYLDFLDTLEKCDKEGGVDLFITNYYYEHADGKGNQSINYSNALPSGKVFEWKDTKSFQMKQLLTIHSCTFRTDLMKQYARDLPKKVFYEDNLMVYQMLPHVEKMYYMNADLYRYYIGRAGQSVQEDVMIGRYNHQLIVAQRCFEACHLDDIKDEKQKKYLDHELFMMFGIGVLFSRLNGSEEAEKNVEAMWDACRAFDQKWADYYRYKSLLRFIGIKGSFGRGIVQFVYKLAHRFVRFN